MATSYLYTLGLLNIKGHWLSFLSVPFGVTISKFIVFIDFCCYGWGHRLKLFSTSCRRPPVKNPGHHQLSSGI